MIQTQDRENFYMLSWLDQFMSGHKGFIAGGCFKNIFNHEKIKDLDIFFKNRTDFEEAIQYFDSMTPGYEGEDVREEEYRFCYENEKVKSYVHIKTGTRIELCSNIFGEAKDVISQFDFTITKFAYYKELVKDNDDSDGTHIEYKIACDDKFFEHLHLKRLVTDDKIPYPMSTFERMIRYVRYGYMPCKETKLKIASSIQKLSGQEIVANNSLYDGMD